MSLWVDITGAINADTVYSEGELVARDAAFKLPEVAFVTADHKALGAMSLPVNGQLESMETTITKIGVDIGLARLVRLQSANLEFRWAQTVKSADGTMKTVGCKAFIRGVPKKLPGISIDPGNLTENEIPIEVTRYQLIADGNELVLIDRLASIIRIDGKDYFDEIRSLL